MKSTVVDESLSSFKPMYCSREYQASTRRHLLSCRSELEAEKSPSECNLSVDLIVVYHVNLSCDGVCVE